MVVEENTQTKQKREKTKNQDFIQELDEVSTTARGEINQKRLGARWTLWVRAMANIKLEAQDDSRSSIVHITYNIPLHAERNYLRTKSHQTRKSAELCSFKNKTNH